MMICTKKQNIGMCIFNALYIHDPNWLTPTIQGKYHYNVLQIQKLICDTHKLDIKKQRAVQIANGDAPIIHPL